jgi:hypothetical protein
LGGSSADLAKSVESGELYPVSAFAVVAEGMKRYKRSEATAIEDTDSMRTLAGFLSDGSHAYGQAQQIDRKPLEAQIKMYLLAHGGIFEEGVNWQDFIQEISDKVKKKASAIDEVNR